MIALFDYDKHRLFMESSFKFEGYDFLYFDEGIPYYSLYRTSRKLNSFWEVKYVAEVLYYLNPNISIELFTELVLDLTDRSNGHVIRTYGESRVIGMCEYVMSNKRTPYVRRYRRIIFNPGKNITKYEKQCIVGTMIGRFNNKKITTDKLYNVIEDLMTTSSKITYVKIAKLLNCTRQTVSTNLTEGLKDIINYHNDYCRV